MADYIGGDDHFGGGFGGNDRFGGGSGTIKIVTEIPLYEGSTEFTPSEYEQVVEAKGMKMPENVVINPIPYPRYTGETTVTPSSDEQILHTEGTVVYSDIVVEPQTASTLQDKSVSYTPSESPQSATVTPDEGYDGMSSVSVSVGAVDSEYIGSDVPRIDETDVTSNDDEIIVPEGYSEGMELPLSSFYDHGEIGVSQSVDANGLVTATATISSDTDYAYVQDGETEDNTLQLSTDNGTTVTPSTSQQTVNVTGKFMKGNIVVNAMPSGSVSASASKGAVSSHSVQVTPSATASAGYVSSGTTTGAPVTVSASELVSGSKSITSNGSDIDVTNYATVDVNVQGSSPVLQTKSVSPSETAQQIRADNGYDGLEEVDISAVSSTYVGSGITRRTSSDLSASGATVSVPSGYYENNASKSVASGSVTAPSSITGTGATVSTATNTLTLTKTVSVTPSVTTPGYVSSGTAGNSSVSLSASVTTQGAQTIYPSASDQTINSGRYLTGNQTIKAVTTSNLTAGNIKQGVTVTVGDSSDADRVLSVTGTYSGGGGGGKNIQVNSGAASIHTNGYTSTGISLTVAKTGTYNVSWTAWRSSSSGTMSTRLRVNNTDGTAQSTWTNTYGQHVVLSNQSYTTGDILTVYANSASTTRYCWVANLIIEEQ